MKLLLMKFFLSSVKQQHGSRAKAEGLFSFRFDGDSTVSEMLREGSL
jgi:hypothetical protein